MKARWIKLNSQAPTLGPRPATAEEWVACDEDDEVIATVSTPGTGSVAYVNVPSTAGSSVYSSPAGGSRAFLTVDAAKRWAERQLSNAYTFTPPGPNWAYTITPCGGTP